MLIDDGRSGKQRSAFTLVELLVAIALIAILAAIILAVFPRGREMARQAACASNTRQIVAAARMYAGDHDRRLVPAMTRGAPEPDRGYSWCVLLQPYIESEELLICPSDPEPRESEDLVCLPHSYGMNFRLTYNTAFGWSPGALTSKLTTVQEHSKKILVFGIDGEAEMPGSSYQWHRLSKVKTRHGERAMFGFLDGHAKALIPEDTVQPENLWE